MTAKAVDVGVGVNRKDLLISEICKADRNQDKGNVESNKEEKGFGKRKKKQIWK